MAFNGSNLTARCAGKTPVILNARRRGIALFLTLLCVAISCSSTPPAEVAEMQSPRPMQYFTPPPDASEPAHPVQGVLELLPEMASGGIEVLKDSFGISSDPRWKLAEFPPFRYRFTSSGQAIIPELQTPQRTTHPYWEIILSPGRAWQDPAHGDWSRAALPFALKEKNQNCTHNGVMKFAWHESGKISQVEWQVSSETCLYLKVNLWGTIAASYEPGPLEDAEELAVAHSAWRAARMPTQPLHQLETRYPQIDLSSMAPSEPEDTSVWGFVTDGIHYRSNCATRHGPYPFCDELALPSYSLAKSIFAGLYYLHLSHEWPGFAGMSVSRLVPECRLPDGRWDDVTMSHLVNMTTGNYDDDDFGKDEDAAKMQGFFLAESHEDKVRFSCEAWPRKSAPGTRAVYHTTDTYLLGTAMNAFIRQLDGPGADIHRDYLYPKLLAPLGLSPLMQWTQRTYDTAAQPFTAYGMEMLSSDVARIADSLQGSYRQQNLFDPVGLEQALFRDTGDILHLPAGRGEAYRNGFWGSDKSANIGCPNETWVPFMSGYGGIIVALMPNGTVYYYFSDSGVHEFTNALLESNKIRNMCKE